MPTIRPRLVLEENWQWGAVWQQGKLIEFGFSYPCVREYAGCRGESVRQCTIVARDHGHIVLKRRGRRSKGSSDQGQYGLVLFGCETKTGLTRLLEHLSHSVPDVFGVDLVAAFPHLLEVRALPDKPLTPLETALFGITPFMKALGKAIFAP